MTPSDRDRLQSDLTSIRSAMGLHLPFGRAMVAADLSLSFLAAASAVASLLLDRDSLQQALPASAIVLGLLALFLRSRRRPVLDPEIVSQVSVSLSVYAVVWVAASGYWMAGLAGSSFEPWRTTALRLASVGLLLAFSFLLVRSALASRPRRYALGLAISTLLAATLLPILDWHHTYPLAHFFMSLGFLSAAAIQSSQLRESVPSHVAD